MSVSSVKRYVGRKVSVVRWRPPHDTTRRSDTFVIGTWGDQEANSVGLWRIPESEEEPLPLSSLTHRGDVTDIQYVTQDSFMVGSSSGCLRLFRHDSDENLKEGSVWDGVHSFQTGAAAPCTSLACSGEQVASVGEDGRLVILNPGSKKPIRVLEGVGGCSLYAVLFVRSHEVLTSSMQGHLKLWDLRAAKAATGTLFSPDQVAVCELAGHPTQQHLVGAGGEDGTLAIWDLRNTAHPFTVIAAHSGPVSQVQFHPVSPDHLFTTGTDGQLLHWDAAPHHSHRPPPPPISYRGGTQQHDQSSGGGSVSVWLGSDVCRGATDTTCILHSPLPINSLDLEATTLIAGSDNEAIYVMGNVLSHKVDDMVY